MRTEPSYGRRKSRFQSQMDSKKNLGFSFGQDTVTTHLPPWLSGLAISGRGAVKAWLAIRQGVGSYPTPAGMSGQVSA